MAKKRIHCCPFCEKKDIEIGDCGYSSFNVGWARCKSCGYEMKFNPCGCFPENEIVKSWNKEARRVVKQNDLY